MVISSFGQKLLLKSHQPKAIGSRFMRDYYSETRNYWIFHSNPKNLLQRTLSLNKKRAARKAQVLTQKQTGLRSTSQQELDEILKNAIRSSGSGSTPSIIIINKTPTLMPNFETINSVSQSKNETCEEVIVNPDSPSSSGFTFKDIDGLIDVANAIGKVYDGYYQIFPDKNEVLPKEKTSLFDSTAAVLSFYGKVRGFIVAVIKEKSHLSEDLNKIKTSAYLIKPSQMDMLRFLGLDRKYSILKIKTGPYESYDPKFNSYYMDIVDMTINFEINVRSLLQTVANLNDYTQIFFSAVNELVNIGINKYESNFMNIADKIDTVLMFLASMAQLQTELNGSIENLKTSLRNLATDRQRLEDSLDKMSTLADFYQTRISEKDSFLIFRTSSKLTAYFLTTLFMFLIGP